MSHGSDPLSRLHPKRAAPTSSYSGAVAEKRQKLDTPISVKSGGEARSKAHAPPGVESVPEEDPIVSDIPQIGYESDEDGRFFGGGLSTGQAKALDFLETKEQGDDTEAVVSMDMTVVKRLVSKLEKAITKNEKMRARYSDEPTKFMESEAELDSDIRNLNSISEYPDLWPSFVETGAMTTIISLIGHENTDIANDTLQIIEDLTDDENSASDEALSAIVASFLDSQGLEILVQHLARLDEGNLEEREAVFKCCSILENVVSIEADVKEELFKKTSMSTWLVQRLQKTDEQSGMDQNKQYAAELLSILIQDCPANAQSLVLEEALDVMLLQLAPYRKVSFESGSLEEEYVENCFDILSILASTESGKNKFIDGEGVELMQRLFTDAKSSRIRLRALQALEYGCSGWTGGAVCAQVVDVGLLRNLFSVFMRKDDEDILKACLGIFVSFFRTLNDGEAERIRVISKFSENDYQKTKRLLELRSRYASKHASYVDRSKMTQAQKESLSDEERAEYELTNYLDRLDNGLDALQLADVLLAWIYASSPDISAANISMPSTSEMKIVLNEMMEALKEQGAQDSEEGAAENDVEKQQEYEMLEALANCI